MDIDHNKYINIGNAVKHLENDLALETPAYSCYHWLWHYIFYDSCWESNTSEKNAWNKSRNPVF